MIDACGAKVYSCDARGPGVAWVDNFKTSGEMWKALAGRKVDLFFFDGAITEVAELKAIGALSHETSVYIFDDFEFLEKGVLNCMAIRRKVTQELPQLIAAKAGLAVLFNSKIMSIIGRR